MGAVAVRETYQFFTDPNCKKLGGQAWLMSLTVLVETLCCVKWGRGQFPNPAPRWVVHFWQVLLSILVIFPVWQFWLRPHYFPPSSAVVAAKGSKATSKARSQ
jgi:phosphatidylserine synthase 2